MKKSADSQFYSSTPQCCGLHPHWIPPMLVSNRVPAQTLISVFLEFLIKMHTRKRFQPGHSFEPPTGKRPLNSQKPGLQPVREEAPASVCSTMCFMASLHIIKTH